MFQNCLSFLLPSFTHSLVGCLLAFRKIFSEVLQIQNCWSIVCIWKTVLLDRILNSYFFPWYTLKVVSLIHSKNLFGCWMPSDVFCCWMLLWRNMNMTYGFFLINNIYLSWLGKKLIFILKPSSFTRKRLSFTRKCLYVNHS